MPAVRILSLFRGFFCLSDFNSFAKFAHQAVTLAHGRVTCTLIDTPAACSQLDALFERSVCHREVEVVIVKLAWHFSKVNPRFKNREATQGEFFASDTELRGFVREAIQNSLDARRPGFTGAIGVRIFLSGTENALPRETSKRYFRGGWDHFRSESSGLRDAPVSDELCQFVVYEDSGTTGLTGDTDQYHEISGRRNPFYYFFRAEGQSNKRETGRGRWGLGKYVFPRSSRIRTFFGLTVRCDDRRRLLVGQSILRSHEVDGKSYTPDGWFGGKPPREDAAPPVEDDDFIDHFERDFCLERKRDPGLSIVVPFCDPTWDVTQVASCIVQDYFSAILRDELVVTVESPDTQLVIHSQSIADVLTQCDEDVQLHIRPLLDLTLWSKACQESGQLIVLARRASRGVPRWTRRDLDDEVFARIRREYRSTGRAAIRIPLLVQPKGGEPRQSHFDVFLERCESTVQRRPVFIREGIVISGVRSRLIRDVSAIVQIEDAPLATFLGDAENPAHTEWHEESSHFKGKYLHGTATLRFVRNTVPDLCQLLSEELEAEDSELLLDVFSIGTEGGQAGYPVGFESRKSRERSSAGLAKLQSAAPRAKACRITRRKGGFCITGTGQSETESADTSRGGPKNSCKRIEVRMAYDRRQGSPLRRYSATDFQLSEAPICIESSGTKTEIGGPNLLILTPEAGRFEVIVTGFDINRDLYVVTQSGKLHAST